MPSLNLSDQVAPTLISVQDKHPQKEGWKQTEAREGTLEAQVLKATA